MTSSTEAVAAVAAAVVAAGLPFTLTQEGLRVFAIVATHAEARDAAKTHLTYRAPTAAKGKPHA